MKTVLFFAVFAASAWLDFTGFQGPPSPFVGPGAILAQLCLLAWLDPRVRAVAAPVVALPDPRARDDRAA